MLLLRVFIPEATPEGSTETHHRVVAPDQISIKSARAANPPPQQAPHIIPDDTNPMPQAASHSVDKYKPMPPFNSYNTRSLRLQVQDIMSNHVVSIKPPTPTPRNLAPILKPAGEYLSVIYKDAGYINLHPIMINSFICPNTVKSQDYHHIMIGTYKYKCSKFMSNDLCRLFQVIGNIKVSNTLFFTHRKEVPQDAKVAYL